MQIIETAQLQPGDILVTRTQWNPILSAIQAAQYVASAVLGTNGRAAATHIALYTGNGMLVESQPVGTGHLPLSQLFGAAPRWLQTKAHCDFAVYRLSTHLYGRFGGVQTRKRTRELSESVAELAAMCALTVHYLRKHRDPSLGRYSMWTVPFSVFSPESLQRLRDMLPAILARLIPGAPTNPWDHGVRNIICSQFVMLMFHAAAEAKGVDFRTFCPPSHLISPADLEAWLIRSSSWQFLGTLRVHRA